MDEDPEEVERWKTFGQWILRRRVAELGLSRREVAEAGGLSISTLQNLEDGGRKSRGQWLVPAPNVPTLRRLSRGLKLPLQEVLDRAGRKDIDATDISIWERSSPAALTDKLQRLSRDQRETILRLVDDLLGPDEPED